MARTAEALDFLWKWGERLWKVVPWLLISIAALGTGRAAQMSAWLSAYGPISWVVAGLLGGLLFALILQAIAWAFQSYAQALWVRSVSKRTETINPLDNVFTSKKIDINVFRRPVPTEFVAAKTFVDCELMGPAVVFFGGSVTWHDAGIINCDFVEVHDTVTVQNVIPFKDITIRGGKVYFLTVLVPKRVTGSIPPGAHWITPR